MDDNQMAEIKKGMEKMEEVWNLSNESIIENERVVDRQSTIISVGILLQLFALLESDFISNLSSFQGIMLIVIFFLSILSLLFSILVPIWFIDRRRALKNELSKIPWDEYTEKKVQDCEQKYMKTKNIDTPLRISFVERARLLFIVLTIIFSLVFYMKIWYDKLMADSSPIPYTPTEKGAGADSIHSPASTEKGAGADSTHSPIPTEKGAGADSTHSPTQSPAPTDNKEE